MGFHLTEPYQAPAQDGAKNRVWGFEMQIGVIVRNVAPQPVEVHQATRPTPTKPASGIPYWLSRDPIGEDGGLNLYGFLHNDGVNRVDRLGLDEYTDGLRAAGLGPVPPGAPTLDDALQIDGAVSMAEAQAMHLTQQQARGIIRLFVGAEHIRQSKDGMSLEEKLAALRSNVTTAKWQLVFKQGRKKDRDMLVVYEALLDLTVLMGAVAVPGGCTPAAARVPLAKPFVAAESVAQRSMQERLDLFFRDLRSARPARNADEALVQVRGLLDRVEDVYRGVPRNPNPGLKPDGRMYPPQADHTFRNPNGSITAVTKGHKIAIGCDGSIKIGPIQGSKIDFSKAGAR